MKKILENKIRFSFVSLAYFSHAFFFCFYTNSNVHIMDGNDLQIYIYKVHKTTNCYNLPLFSGLSEADYFACCMQFTHQVQHTEMQ